MKNIFFCGYSLPDADIQIKYLLKRAQINRDSDLHVFVANRAISGTEQYDRFFGPGVTTNLEMDFKDFVTLDDESIKEIIPEENK